MARGRAASTAAARLARIAAGETTSGVMATSSSSSASASVSSSSSAAASRALARLFGSRAAGLASAYGTFDERALCPLRGVESGKRSRERRLRRRTEFSKFLQHLVSFSPSRDDHDNGRRPNRPSAKKKNKISIQVPRCRARPFPSRRAPCPWRRSSLATSESFVSRWVKRRRETAGERKTRVLKESEREREKAMGIRFVSFSLLCRLEERSESCVLAPSLSPRLPLFRSPLRCRRCPHVAVCTPAP